MGTSLLWWGASPSARDRPAPTRGGDHKGFERQRPLWTRTGGGEVTRARGRPHARADGGPISTYSGRPGLHQPELAQAHDLIAAADQVIVHRDPQSLGGGDHLLGNVHIRTGGRWIAGGMVVGQHERA